MTIFLLLIGFVVLLFSADWLVDGASALARKFNIPNIVVGLTVVAFGTSAPELVVSLLSALNGESELSLTNVLGSNIINTYVILGVAALIYPLSCGKTTMKYEIPLSILAGFAILIFGTDCFDYVDVKFEGLSRWNGIVLLVIFCCFVAYTIYQGTHSKNTTEEAENEKTMPMWKSITLIIVGLGGLMLGGHFIVESAVKIAESFNVPKEVIGVTIVALGTSLPELATSAVAAFKKNTDLAIGNVIGSNIFNVFMVLGISATISPLKEYCNMMVDSIFAIIASSLVLLFVISNKKRQITRWHGLILLIIYIIYVTWLISNI